MIEVRCTEASHPRRGSEIVVELRCRYDPYFKDHLKGCLYDTRDLLGHDVGWSADRRCWWIDRAGWTVALVDAIEADGEGFVDEHGWTLARSGHATNGQRHAPPHPPSPQPKQRQPHDVLGVRITATREEVEEAYRRLSKQYHPDLVPGNLAPEFREMAHARMVEINNAHDALKKGRR